MTNCPKDYKNLGCESFADERKLTLEMFRQFCKNDAYFYDQINKLWDATDPESRKRFYPPFFMDVRNSFGVEPCKKGEFNLEDVEEDLYHLANSRQEIYRFNFDQTDDGANRDGDILVIDDEDIIEDDSTLHIVTEYDSSTDTITHKLVPHTVTATIDAEFPYVVGKKSTKTIKNKVDVYAKKSKLDAYCDGAYHDWKCNSVWYIGYNRHKNYNIKNKWRKNPDDTSIPSVCRAQTFKAKQTGLLTKVGFKMRGSKSSASPLIVEIRTTKKGKPTSTVLASTKQKFNHSTSSMVNFTFDKACKIEAGKRYAIVLRSPLSQFNHCYWVGGWASSCFSNSRKRAYYDGETFLSEDNGKTWITHGKKEKCYGSHYYDWGFAEPPVNFGFEVYVAPYTGSKTTKTYKTTNSQTTKTYTKSFTFDYYQKGTYYLNFKGFCANSYTQVICNHTDSVLTNGNNYIGDWSWEIYCQADNTWKSFPDYAEYCGNVETVASNQLKFSRPMSFVKVRLKLVLDKNIPVDKSTQSTYDEIIEDVGKLKIQSSELTAWKNKINSLLTWNYDGIKQVNTITVNLMKNIAPYGYLHTLDYHPEQDTMLPASIWAEVNAKALTIGNNTKLKIDIVHEEDKIERFILTRTDNYELLDPYLREFLGSYYSTCSVASYQNGTLSQQCTAMENYIVDNNGVLTDNGEKFYDFLKTQNPKIYFLPTQTVNYLEGYGKDCITLEDYPSYAINNVTLTSQSDVVLDWDDLTVSSGTVTYTVPRSISIDQIVLRYAYDGEEGIEYDEANLVNYADNTTDWDFKVNDNVITFNFANSSRLGQLATASGSTLTVKNDNYSFTPPDDWTGLANNETVVSSIHPHKSNIIFETSDFNLNEFEDYLVDYDNKLVKFLNPQALIEGDVKINYNPVWARNLDIEDFPLKLDLWIEQFVMKTEANKLYFGKLYYDGSTAKVRWFGDERSLITLTSPRDNLREVVMNEENDNIQYEEDTHFEVDYLTNTVKFRDGAIILRDIKETVTDPNNKATTIGDIITVKYTPNLTDNGLAMVYKMYRSGFVNGIDGLDPNTVDTFTLLYNTPYSASMTDDVFIGSNYWTYRT